MNSMNLLGLTILFSSCSHICALLCLTTEGGKPLEMSLEDFDLNQFKTQIQKMPSDPYDDKDSLCRVVLHVKHYSGKLIVEFTGNPQDTWLYDQEIELDTRVSGIEGEDMDVAHKLAYACSSDKCEISFIIQHIQWLIDAKYPQFSNQLAPLFFGNGKEPGKCFVDDDTLETCEFDQCRIDILSRASEGLDVKQSCDENDGENDGEKREDTLLWFTATLFSNLQSVELDHDFYCHYEQCNDESVMQNIRKIFDKVYNITAVLTMLGYKIENEEEQQEMTTNSMQSSALSNTQQETNSFGSTLSAGLSTTRTVTSTTVIRTTTAADGRTSAVVDGQTSTTADGRTSAVADGQTSTAANGRTNAVTDSQTTTVADGQTSTTTAKTNIGHNHQNSNLILYTILMTFIFHLFFSI